MTESLRRIARWLESRPWNQPRADKTWVLRSMSSHRAFAEARKRARRISKH